MQEERRGVIKPPLDFYRGALQAMVASAGVRLPVVLCTLLTHTSQLVIEEKGLAVFLKYLHEHLMELLCLGEDIIPSSSWQTYTYESRCH